MRPESAARTAYQALAAGVALHVASSGLLHHALGRRLHDLAGSADHITREAALGNGLFEYVAAAVWIPPTAPLLASAVLATTMRGSIRNCVIAACAAVVTWSAVPRLLALPSDPRSFEELVFIASSLPGLVAALSDPANTFTLAPESMFLVAVAVAVAAAVPPDAWARSTFQLLSAAGILTLAAHLLVHNLAWEALLALSRR